MAKSTSASEEPISFTNRMASATGMIPNREYHALAR